MGETNIKGEPPLSIIFLRPQPTVVLSRDMVMKIRFLKMKWLMFYRSCFNKFFYLVGVFWASLPSGVQTCFSLTRVVIVVKIKNVGIWMKIGCN